MTEKKKKSTKKIKRRRLSNKKDFITSYYTEGENTKDIYEVLNIKKGQPFNTTPSINDYRRRVFHR